MFFVLNKRSIEDLLCPTTIWSGSPRIEISSYFVDLPSFTLARLLWFKFSLPEKYKVLAQELNRNIEKQHKYSDSLVWIVCIFIFKKLEYLNKPRGGSSSPDISRMTCCDHGYGRPSWRPRVSTPATYRSGTSRNQHSAVARWHIHLRGLATAIHETSGLLELSSLWVKALAFHHPPLSIVRPQ